MAFVQVYTHGVVRCHESTAHQALGSLGRAAYQIVCPGARRSVKRCRYSYSGVSMNAEDKEVKEFQDEEERRLQNDKRYVFREFGKITVAALCIGLVLFFYDILISLVAMSIGCVYAIAVLLEVRGADTLLSRMVGSVASTWNAMKKKVEDGYRAIRREVRKGLED